MIFRFFPWQKNSYICKKWRINNMKVNYIDYQYWEVEDDDGTIYEVWIGSDNKLKCNCPSKDIFCRHKQAVAEYNKDKDFTWFDLNNYY
jgi:hypothetical protein